MILAAYSLLLATLYALLYVGNSQTAETVPWLFTVLVLVPAIVNELGRRS